MYSNQKPDQSVNRLVCRLAYSSSLYPGKLTAGPSLKLNGALWSQVSFISCWKLTVRKGGGSIQFRDVVVSY